MIQNMASEGTESYLKLLMALLLPHLINKRCIRINPNVCDKCMIFIKEMVNCTLLFAFVWSFILLACLLFLYLQLHKCLFHFLLRNKNVLFTYAAFVLFLKQLPRDRRLLRSMCILFLHNYTFSNIFYLFQWGFVVLCFCCFVFI